MKTGDRIIAILFSLITGLCIPSTGGFAQELSVDFEEQLVFGDEEDAPEEYLFGGPQFIKTDSEYRIYVATMNTSIRVFSPKGKYLKTIGREGKGPGEFVTITAMAIGNNDELIVYDGRLRRLTRFYDFGDSLNSKSLSHPDWTGGDIVPLSDEQFASVAISPAWLYEYSDEHEVPNYEDKLIHLLDGYSWEKIRSHFNVYDNMPFDKDEPVEARFAMGGDYRLAKLNDSTLAITHTITDGNVYLVNTNDGQVRKVQGHFIDRDSYELLDWQYRRSYQEQRFNVVTSSASPNTSALVYQIKLRSRALLANDKWLLHFIQTADGNKTTYNIEFVDSKGKYYGYTSIQDDLNVREQREIKQYFFPKHLDDQNQLYYTDYSSGVPVIRVTKILMEAE